MGVGVDHRVHMISWKFKKERRSKSAKRRHGRVWTFTVAGTRSYARVRLNVENIMEYYVEYC